MIRRFLGVAALLAGIGAAAYSSATAAPEWVSKAENAGELISLEYFRALLPKYRDRIATTCRTYEAYGRFYVHCLPAPYERFIGWGRDILLEWKDGALYPVNGTTEAAIRRFRRVRMGLPESAKSFSLLGATVMTNLLRGDVQPFQVLERIERGDVKRVD